MILSFDAHQFIIHAISGATQSVIVNLITSSIQSNSSIYLRQSQLSAIFY